MKLFTKSICPVCLKKIDAEVIILKKGPVIIKKCPTHGKFRNSLGVDKDFFFSVRNQKRFIKNESRLEIPVSHSCNLYCNYCYYPFRGKKELSLDEILMFSKRFKGDYVCLSGGEPTLRKDLMNLIQQIRIKTKKIPVLVTNGKKLKDADYVKNLKYAGIGLVHIPLNTTSSDPFVKNGMEITKTRKKALENLNKHNILTSLSILIQQGINEEEIKKIIHLAIKDWPNVFEVKIRSANNIGRHSSNKVYSTSDLLKIFLRSYNLDKDKVYEKINRVEKGKALCRFSAKALIDKRSNKIISLIPFGRTGRPNINTFLWRTLPKILSGLLISIFRKIEKFELLTKMGFDGIKMLMQDLFSHNIALLRIELRSWPNSNNIDLKDIKNCPSLTLNVENKKFEPFCLSIIRRNEKQKNNIKKN